MPGYENQLAEIVAELNRWITMEQSLAEMVKSGKIHRDVAMSHCFRTEDLVRYLQE